MQGPLSARGTGRVEVFYKGQWGTICAYSWDIKDAKVACRQLGFKNAIKVLPGRDVSDGSGKRWLTDVNCAGSEPSLGSCSHGGTGYCWNRKDAGVQCSSTGKPLYCSYHTCNLRRTLLTRTYPGGKIHYNKKDGAMVKLTSFRCR